MYELLEAGNSENKVIAVKNEGMEIIKIPYYFNLFHNSNIYFKVDEVKSFDKVNSDILDNLCSYFGKPIQIVISSDRKILQICWKIWDLNEREPVMRLK